MSDLRDFSRYADQSTDWTTGVFVRQGHIFLFTTVPTGPLKFLQELDAGGFFR